jgi:hypothetical protein
LYDPPPPPPPPQTNTLPGAIWRKYGKILKCTNLYSRNKISPCVEVSDSRSTVGSGAHTILVILTDKHTW